MSPMPERRRAHAAFLRELAGRLSGWVGTTALVLLEEIAHDLEVSGEMPAEQQR